MAKVEFTELVEMPPEPDAEHGPFPFKVLQVDGQRCLFACMWCGHHFRTRLYGYMRARYQIKCAACLNRYPLTPIMEHHWKHQPKASYDW